MSANLKVLKGSKPTRNPLNDCSMDINVPSKELTDEQIAIINKLMDAADSNHVRLTKVMFAPK